MKIQLTELALRDYYHLEKNYPKLRLKAERIIEEITIQSSKRHRQTREVKRI